MPIGAHPAGRTAIGPSIIPVGIPAGTDAEGAATGPAVDAYLVGFRSLSLLITGAPAAMPMPAPGQYHEIERVVLIDAAGGYRFVLSAAAADPGLIDPMYDAVRLLGTPGEFYVLDTATPIRQAEGQPLNFMALDSSGQLDTGAFIAITVQYRVLSTGAR